LAAGTVASQAREVEQRESDRGTYAWWSWGGLEGPINHLNRMVGHVRWEMGRYHASQAGWRQFAEIRRDVDRVNATYRSPKYDHGKLRREIEVLRGRLHQLEINLHARKYDYYRWK
jgi:hypothetical protein